MARDFTILKSKRFWILLVTGVLLLLFAVFLQMGQQGELPLSPISRTEAEDFIPPASSIVSPEDRTWHNTGFSVAVRDSDVGAGLTPLIPGTQGCLYRIDDFGADQAFGGFRQCKEASVFISVGKDQACSSSYEKDSSAGRCRVSVKAVDKAGNESSWKSSLFFIDLENPVVSGMSLRTSTQEGYLFQGEVSDNGKIVSCWLAEDTHIAGATVSFDSLPCQEGRECRISAQYTPEGAGIHTVRFECKDAAGNVGHGEPLSSFTFINQAPQIALCRVLPSQGSQSTVFKFESEASDPNQDVLSFRWDFGDGGISIEQNPSHAYGASGIYAPKLTVQDPVGASDQCSTAWVIVGEK